ncbi:hypothetical protein FFLO_06297 [Filobasidium floriforme]|uniref:Phytanoyl-CoA dioxygenase n=1 Tax=Filobasidium floriforme TaxID=5210 RepID=A0A8K0NQL2_9TREE|nr:uncharacterized protein HD553DRAFT_342405 [Filobasidium floriforme]KAG7528265.1 hypothetical protein FFLO_06297 [Filobasidium floriforme]KAH8084019.1 hypothetical protein HD553DRAFT_342405 [Filobasidium floriforme]
MPIATQTQTTTLPTSSPSVLKLRAPNAQEPAHVKQLRENGFAVVPNVLGKERAEEYVRRANEWLKAFGKGFDVEDRSTWHVQNLPPHHRGGLYNDLAVGHEDLLWSIRAEPELIKIFAELWGTDELLVSFDGANFSIPLPKEEIQNGGAPWPHVDQSPLKRELNCVQGIMNLAPNGPTDGGLMVLSGSFPLYKQFFEEHAHEEPEGGWPKIDSYHHTPSQLQWFYDRGCEWKHVDAGAGDVILWDSRCIHYGAAPTGDNARYATYVCYKPADMCSPEHLEERKQAAAKYYNMSHDPTCARVVTNRQAAVRSEPSKPFQHTERTKRLAGIEAY